MASDIAQLSLRWKTGPSFQTVHVWGRIRVGMIIEWPTCHLRTAGRPSLFSTPLRYQAWYNGTCAPLGRSVHSSAAGPLVRCGSPSVLCHCLWITRRPRPSLLSVLSCIITAMYSLFRLWQWERRTVEWIPVHGCHCHAHSNMEPPTALRYVVGVGGLDSPWASVIATRASLLQARVASANAFRRSHPRRNHGRADPPTVLRYVAGVGGGLDPPWASVIATRASLLQAGDPSSGAPCGLPVASASAFRRSRPRRNHGRASWVTAAPCQ